MANLKEVRGRIQSVINTQQITKAMKLVAASKLKRAQDKIVQMRPYADKLFDILANILASIEGEDMSLNFNDEREVKSALIVVVTSDKGLCGGFNSNLIKRANQLAFGKYNDLRKSGNLKVLCIGKKGFDFFKNREVEVISDYVDSLTHLTFEQIAEITEILMSGFLEKKYDVIDVVYSKFKNAGTQIFSEERFLPIAKLDSEEAGTSIRPDYIFEPVKKELISELVPKILKTQFYRYLLDSNASEHGARMVAMDQASENANELLQDLRILYNRERQAAITKEILEIVGGAAALEQG